MKFAIYAEVKMEVEPPATTKMVKEYVEELLEREGFQLLRVYPTTADNGGGAT